MPLYFLTLLLVTTAAADTYNTFRGNPQLTGVASSNLAPPLTLRWAYSTQDAIESTAAIHEGTVYVGSLDGQLYALDLHTGALVWQYQADDEIKSSPTIADSTIYFGDEAGTFHAVAIQKRSAPLGLSPPTPASSLRPTTPTVVSTSAATTSTCTASTQPPGP